MKYVSLLLLCLATAAQAQTSITIPQQTGSFSIPQQTVTLTPAPPAPPVCVALNTSPAQTLCGPALTLSTATPTPPVTPPPVNGVTWGYTNGVFSWAGDFTQNGTSVNYHHATTSGLAGHTSDILFTSNVNWGLWLPYFAPGSSGYAYPNPGFTSLLISVKPTVTGQAFGIFMMRTGDIDPGCHLELLNYGPPTVAGVWGSYTIPLKDLCTASDPTLYKMGLQDHAANPSSWEMDNVGFK